MTKPAAISQADLTRIFKSAKRAGVHVRLRLDPASGTIDIHTTGAEAEKPTANPWDQELQ